MDSDGKADPGDTLRYTVTVTNSGTDAADVQLNSELSSITTLAAGTFAISPIAADDSYRTLPNTPLSVTAPGLLANDFAGQNPSGTITAFDASSAQCNACSNVTVNPANGSFTYMPPASFTGTDTFTYSLSNAAGSSTGTVTILVNSPPVAVDNNYSTPQNQQFARNAPGFLGNDTLNGGTVVSHTDPANGTLDAFGTDGSFRYTPNSGFSGNDTFTYTLQNAAGSSTATVTIYVDVLPTITSVAPLNGSTCVPLDSTITINLSEIVATTAAFSILPSVAFTQSPTDGNATNSFTLTPTGLSQGTEYSVTVNRFQVADIDGGHSPAANYLFSFTAMSAPGAVNDGVNNPDPPVETTINTSVDTALLPTPVTILSNDTLPCGATLAFFGATGPFANVVVDGTNTAATQQGGSVLLRPDGTFLYTPAMNFTGSDGFFYKLQNDAGISQAQVRLRVVSAPLATLVPDLREGRDRSFPFLEGRAEPKSAVNAAAETRPVVTSDAERTVKTRGSSTLDVIASAIDKITDLISPTAHAQKLAPESGETVTSAPLTLPAGKSVKIVYGAVVNDGPFAAGIDNITNEATIFGLDFASVTTNTASIPLDAAPDLQVAATDLGTTTQPGGTVSYTLNYLNVVPLASPVRTQGATGAAITASVPANSTFNAVTSSPG